MTSSPPLPERNSGAPKPSGDGRSWGAIDADRDRAPKPTAFGTRDIAVRLAGSLVLVIAALAGVLLVASTDTGSGLQLKVTSIEPTPASQPEGAAEGQPEPTASSALVLPSATTPTATVRPTTTPLPAVATPTPPPASQRVEEVIAQLDQDASEWTGGASVSMAVVVDGLILGINPEQQQNSASEMKPVWLTAAAETAGIEAVADLSAGIFGTSSNSDAATAIEVLGIDEVNRWTTQLGLRSTYLASWRNPDPDRPDLAASDQAVQGRINRSSALDQVTFLVALERGDLLPVEDTATMLEWMRLTPDSSTGSDPSAVFVNELPETVASDVSHKAGWLPPDCCVRDARVLNALGFVPLPSGQQVPVAIMTELGEDYDGQSAFISSAICQLYEVLAPTSLECPTRPS